MEADLSKLDVQLGFMRLNIPMSRNDCCALEAIDKQINKKQKSEVSSLPRKTRSKTLFPKTIAVEDKPHELVSNETVKDEALLNIENFFSKDEDEDHLWYPIQMENSFFKKQKSIINTANRSRLVQGTETHPIQVLITDANPDALGSVPKWIFNVMCIFVGNNNLLREAGAQIQDNRGGFLYLHTPIYIYICILSFLLIATIFSQDFHLLTS